ncbi:short chain dehydrogenase [Pseudoscourfieldia marina]
MQTEVDPSIKFNSSLLLWSNVAETREAPVPSSVATFALCTFALDKQHAMPLHGHTVLLTGASSGIGSQLALEIARRKPKTLVLTARRKQLLSTLAAEVKKECPDVECEVVVGDLGKPGGAKTLYEDCTKKGLDITALALCAGIAKAGEFASWPAEEYETMTAINLSSTFVLCRSVLPTMLERRRGKILFVASQTAYAPVPLFAAYAATKAAVLSFAEALDAEVGHRGVGIAVVTPGGVASGGNFDATAGMNVTKLGLGLFGGRILLPYPYERSEDVARAAAHALDRAGDLPRLWPSPVQFTSSITGALTSFRGVLPRWLFARLQGYVMAPGIPKSKGGSGEDTS